jgi:hypothetical protein
MQCYKVNMDNYQYYLMAMVWIFKVIRIGLGQREYLFFVCIIWSQ